MIRQNSLAFIHANDITCAKDTCFDVRKYAFMV